MLTGSPGTFEQKLEGKEGDSPGGRTFIAKVFGEPPALNAQGSAWRPSWLEQNGEP